MTALAPLRSRLNALRLARSAVRWGCALSGLVITLVMAWGIAYLLDRGLDLSWYSRLFVLIAWAVGIGWFAFRRIAPPLLQAETLDDIALDVEHRQRIDSDLIAALQFDAVPRGTWGSPRLSSAVVEYVAAFSPSLNVFEGFSWRPLPSRLVIAAAVSIAAAALCVVFPQESAAFWNRFWLGNAHYPTRTIIEKLVINGEIVPVFHAKPVRLRVPQGEALRVEAECNGELPTEGHVQVRGLRSRSSGVWNLKAAAASQFQSEPQSLVEDLRLRAKLGDAVSDPIDIAVVPLPIIELRWKVTPPAYAPHSEESLIPDGSRQFAVLAGSRLALQVKCLNKGLKSARIAADGQITSLLPDPDRGAWTLPAGTVFDNVAESLSYELAVEDEDGLSPAPPIAGQIRLRPDRAPRVAAAVISRKVLPTAKPRVSYGAVDDFGIARIVMTLEITPAEGEPRRSEIVVWEQPANQHSEASVRGETALDLSPYQLTKGDQVQVTVAAEDSRGAAPPQRGQSEPITLEVTDRNGIFAGLLETDQQSAKQLDAIILRELGIGGGKK